MGARFMDSLSGLTTLRLCRATQREQASLAATGEAYRQETMAVLRIAFLSALVLERLGVPAEACIFADDTEENLVPAAGMGMTVIHALDERETAARLRQLLGLRSR